MFDNPLPREYYVNGLSVTYRLKRKSKMSQRVIAIVEDDEQQRSHCACSLREEGYVVNEYATREAAITAFKHQLPDLAILDIMLGQEIDGGYDICRYIKAHEVNEVPILFLTSRGNEVDKIYGLDLGAWDYQTKPVTLIYLHAKVRSLFKIKYNKGGFSSTNEQDNKQIGGLIIYPDICTVTWNKQGVGLTPTEFSMLQRLVEAPDGVSYQEFADVTRQGVVENNTINTHIGQIRTKFKKVDPLFNGIRTRYGFGYKLLIE